MKAIAFVFVILMSSCFSKQLPRINYISQLQTDHIPEIFGANLISVQGRFDLGFTISPDGKSMAFGVVDENNLRNTSIYLMSFSRGKWSSPNKDLLPDNINTSFPMFGPTAHEFYFAKPVNNSETDIWLGRYDRGKIRQIQPLGSPINSVSREAGHSKSRAGSFYFTSNRDDKNKCCGDIFRSEIDRRGNYTSPYKVAELNSISDEEGLFVSSNEDFIIIQSWKNEYTSKHDLYLSYRTKNGVWTIPRRLDATINTKEIEQRPFVSPDNKYLFFSRMNTSIQEEKEAYESDIFWVSTKSIFKPYPYNLSFKYEVLYNEPFRIELPKDLFKDVDDKKLVYRAALENEQLPNWIMFDESKFVLYGTWTEQRDLEIVVQAIDKYGNVGNVKIPINMKTN